MAQDAVHAACVPYSGSNGTLVALHSTSRYPVTVTVHWHVDIHYVTDMILSRRGTGKAGRSFELEKESTQNVVQPVIHHTESRSRNTDEHSLSPTTVQVYIVRKLKAVETAAETT